MRLARLHDKDLDHEPIWHIAAAVGTAIVLQTMLSGSLAFGSKYTVAALEALLLIIVILPQISASVKRWFSILLVALISLANLVSLSLVVHALFNGVTSGRSLLISSVAIYLTNIIVFGIWYWELDNTRRDVPDFLFPQFADGTDKTSWRPTLFDYIYVSITNATAFSPTDTMPLTHRAKLLMTFQSLVALATVALVAARAVNILS